MNTSKGFTDDCIIYTGAGTFSDISASTSITECQPYGLSSQTTNHAAQYVGYLSTPYEPYPSAFYDIATEGSGSITFGKAYTAHYNSYFYGVNFSGEAVGTSYYAPVGNFFSNNPLFVAPPGGLTFNIAQPQCITTARYCALPYPNGPCAFGGCVINDAGTIIATDGDTPSGYTSLMTYTYGNPASGRDLPISQDATTQFENPVLINNLDQVLYLQYTPSTKAYNSEVYSITTGKTATIPSIKGNSCTEYYPISLNNVGQVLGYTDGCKVATDSIYWTWDSTHGTQSLNAEIPANGYSGITPLGINDNGQILVSLYTATSTHWGTLNPPGTGATIRR